MSERDWDADWAICEKATPGPWEAVHTPNDGTWIANEECGIISPYNNDKGQARLAISEEDLEFTTMARSALPYWLQRVKELESSLRMAYLPYWFHRAKELEAEIARLRPVVEAAKKLYALHVDDLQKSREYIAAEDALFAAVDALEEVR